VLAALAVAALIVVACGPVATPGPSGAEPSMTPAISASPATSPPPSSSPGASSTATLAPSPSAAPALAIQANIAARVTVAELNVRQWPATSATKLGVLKKGDVVALLGYGGIKAGGYVWFQAGRIKGLHGPLPALPADPLTGDWNDLIGWIAVGTGSTSYVAPLAPRCSNAAATDLATLQAMLPGEQLACLGDTPLTLVGTWGCGGCGGDFFGTFKPEWLATPLSGFLSVNWSARLGPLQLYFPPAVSRPLEGTILRVHGHLDDARASTCAVAVPTSDDFTAPLVPIRAKDAVLWCRQHVVVDSYEVLGTDPSFPPA
jgi:hypothetical protein